MVRSTSASAGKYLISGEDRSDMILRLANQSSPVDPKVGDTSPSETRLASHIFRPSLIPN